MAESQLRVVLVAGELSMEELRRLLSVQSGLVAVGEARTAALAGC